jgi:hypothetical protein
MNLSLDSESKKISFQEKSNFRAKHIWDWVFYCAGLYKTTIAREG